jgi:hypothetical protein
MSPPIRRYISAFAGIAATINTVVPSFKLSFLFNVMLILSIDGTHHGRVANHWPTRQQWLTPTSPVDLVCLQHEGSAVDCAFNDAFVSKT